MVESNTKQRKIALLIGNNNYKTSSLLCCVNDASDLSGKLEGIGFHVTKYTDHTYEQMDKGIMTFIKSIMPGDIVLFFFAGHGVQWKEENYLIPCDDDRIEDNNDLKIQAINVQHILGKMSDKNPFVIIYLLDCCRTYWLPNVARIRDMNLPRGMARMHATAGSLVAFACAPGTTAQDNASNGRNGVFTYHLLQHITKPGENILHLMADVTNGVAIETSETQVPYVTSNLRTRNIYLVPSIDGMGSLPSLGRKLGLIILGNSGVGKSFLANILLSKEAFAHSVSPRAVTTQTEFEEIIMGNETYAIFNIPGLIEADQKRIETNKIEIDKAFSERPTSLVLYVFGSQGGRIRDEDVVAFNALNKAYPFDFNSLVLIVNGLPKNRPRDYEGEVIVLLEELIKVPCQTLCALDMIDQNNEDEKQQLKNKLLQVVVERTAHVHQKKQDIELQSDEVRKAKAQIKSLQESFQQNKQMYEEKIKEQQATNDKTFAEIRSENDSLRRLVERQEEEAREFKDSLLEKEAVYRKEQERLGAEHREEIRKMREAHEKATQEANARHAEQKAKEEAYRKEQERRDAEHREEMLKMQKAIQEANEQVAQQKAKDEAFRKEQEHRDAEHRGEMLKMQKAIQEANEQVAQQKAREEAHRKEQEQRDAKHQQEMDKLQKAYEKSIQEANAHTDAQKAKEEAYRQEQEQRDAEHRKEMLKVQSVIQKAHTQVAQQYPIQEAHTQVAQQPPIQEQKQCKARSETPSYPQQTDAANIPLGTHTTTDPDGTRRTTTRTVSPSGTVRTSTHLSRSTGGFGPGSVGAIPMGTHTTTDPDGTKRTTTRTVSPGGTVRTSTHLSRTTGASISGFGFDPFNTFSSSNFTFTGPRIYR